MLNDWFLMVILFSKVFHDLDNNVLQTISSLTCRNLQFVHLQITQLKIASNPFAKGFRDVDPNDW